MSTPPTLYTGIVLYSARDPEASALLVADDAIAWTGPVDTALRIHGDAARVDAEGMLIAPSFIDALPTADGSAPGEGWLEAAYARGITGAAPGPSGMREGVLVTAPLREGLDYRALSAAGTPLAFGSGGLASAEDPWTWVRAAAHDAPPTRQLSDRAAFLAATRGGRRLLGEPHPGSLQAGVEATFVVWEPTDLTVRGNAAGAQTWSTDPRSRTPLLPDLDAGAPRALRTVVRGRIVHDLLGA